jgi:subtilisin family serine protease
MGAERVEGGKVKATQIQKTSNGKSTQLKTRIFSALLLLVFLASVAAPQAAAEDRLIVRDVLGLTDLQKLCKVLGCKIDRGLGDPDGQLFLIKNLPLINLPLLQSILRLTPGIVSVEVDQIVKTQGADAGPSPSYLTDRTLVNYYGAQVWRGYVTQPANQLIRTADTQSKFKTTGSGVVVAVIDTGVDPNHPVLKSSLLTGYDFTRNQSGGSEAADVTQSTVAVMDKSSTRKPGKVSQSTVAVLDQSTENTLDNPEYAAFGHGTMVAGIVHLVAPQAQILPLKSFNPDGSGYNSDILRAIYYAVDHDANVINMSFNYTSKSDELKRAIDYAAAHGVILVAAAGNSGLETKVYPGAYKGVIDVASTDNNDIQSTFSNYGAPPVWLAAPGEGIMTTYPYNTYAAGWGTSFSAPLVSGTAALMVSTYKVQSTAQSSIYIGPLSIPLSLQFVLTPPSTSPQAAKALSHAADISQSQLGYGRLDTYQAVDAWRKSLGLR